MRALAQDERGTVAIEFAMVAGLFLMMLFGIIAFGFQFAGRIALSYAVAEGGRAAVAGLTDADRESLALSATEYALDGYSGLVKNSTPVVEITTGAGGKKMIRVSVAQASLSLPTLPFVPDLSTLPDVSTTFIVTDPSS
jgi:Flp pilus assembly protein TadG